jgi:hypothetical protein
VRDHQAGLSVLVERVDVRAGGQEHLEARDVVGPDRGLSTLASCAA